MIEKAILIICASYHHKNTMDICKIFIEEMNAVVIEPLDFQEEMLDEFQLVGFGSGIYNGKHHNSLLELAGRIKEQNSKKAFVFSTSTVGLKSLHKNLNKILFDKGFKLVDEFSCKGFTDYSFTKYFFGGMNKGRPNKKDCNEAKKFAVKLMRDL